MLAKGYNAICVSVLPVVGVTVTPSTRSPTIAPTLSIALELYFVSFAGVKFPDN